MGNAAAVSASEVRKRWAVLTMGETLDFVLYSIQSQDLRSWPHTHTQNDCTSKNKLPKQLSISHGPGGLPRWLRGKESACQWSRLWSLGQENPLEEEMGTHSSTLAWKIPWTEEPGGLQSMGSQRVRHGLGHTPPLPPPKGQALPPAPCVWGFLTVRALLMLFLFNEGGRIEGGLRYSSPSI